MTTSMNTTADLISERSLLSRPMMAVAVAQFLSALADNAVLIAAIALVKHLPQGADMIPLLQEFFVIPYILLAPFVGPLADAFPKGRVMLLGNGLKLVGTGLMLAGVYPLAAYGLVGVGAAIYSPAKYGILSQLFGPAKLVKANGILEASTIVAILLGVLAGGRLADVSAMFALWCCAGIYATAALANLLIPWLAPEHPAQRFAPAGLVKDFWVSFRLLWASPDVRFSMLGTGAFWGAGATLRLALFAWVPAALSVADNSTPANLMGVVSVGIVLGAALAAAWVSLEKVNRALIGGLLLGPAVVIMSLQHSLPAAVLCLAAVGVGGGLFVVPLNALLQERGHESVGAGRALAAQNLVENLMMLLLVASYGSLQRSGMEPGMAVGAFGTGLALFMAVLAWYRVRCSSNGAPGMAIK